MLNAKTLLTMLATLAAVLLAGPVHAELSSLPPLDIPAEALQSRLSQDHNQLITARIKAVFDAMVRAEDDQAVLQARNQLLDDYARYKNVNYQLTFADVVAYLAGPMLDIENPVFQVNLAWALANMPQVTIQPAMDKMVMHPNSAVRYLGWRGYRQIRMLVLAQGTGFSARMLDELDKAAKSEESWYVMPSIYRMLYIEPDRPSFVMVDIFEQARLRCLDILKQAWTRQCVALLKGSEPAARAGGAAVLTLRLVAESYPKDDSFVQMVIDMLWSCAKAYEDSGGEGPLAETLTPVLISGEELVNFLTKARRNPLGLALMERDTERRSLAVRLGAASWLAELKANGFSLEDPQTHLSLPESDGSD